MTHGQLDDHIVCVTSQCKISWKSLASDTGFTSHYYTMIIDYAKGGATEVYCNHAVCPSVCLLQVFLIAR